MLSRVADAIYWMSRYVERAENLARFVDVTHHMSLDLPPGSEQQWEALVFASGDQEFFAENYGEPTRENVIRFLTFDRNYSASILSCLHAARENARSVRESISSEMWEQINQFYLSIKEASKSNLVGCPTELFDYVKNASHLFIGITIATFAHGEAWHFSRLGRTLERADKTSRILDVKYFTLLPSVYDIGTPIDDLQWSAVLQSVSGFEMFRKRYHGITPKRVVEFLVLDTQFPRAILHCIQTASDSLHEISGTPQGSFQNSAEKCLGRLRSDLAYSTVNEIITNGLHEFLDSLQQKLNQVGESIYNTFIAVEPTNDGL